MDEIGKEGFSSKKHYKDNGDEYCINDIIDNDEQKEVIFMVLNKLKEWIEFRDRDWSRHQEAMKRSGAILAWCGYEVPVKELRLATPRSGLGSDPDASLSQQSSLESFLILDLCLLV